MGCTQMNLLKPRGAPQVLLALLKGSKKFPSAYTNVYITQ